MLRVMCKVSWDCRRTNRREKKVIRETPSEHLASIESEIDGVGSITAGAAKHAWPVFICAHNRIVHAHEDIAIVHQDRICNRRKLLRKRTEADTLDHACYGDRIPRTKTFRSTAI